MKLNPLFRDKTFETKAEFERWLLVESDKKISFADRGQDLQSIWLHKSGEILHANLQASIWNGRFIDLDYLKKGMPVMMWDNDEEKWREMCGLVVDEIKYHNKAVN